MSGSAGPCPHTALFRRASRTPQRREPCAAFGPVIGSSAHFRAIADNLVHFGPRRMRLAHAKAVLVAAIAAASTMLVLAAVPAATQDKPASGATSQPAVKRPDSSKSDPKKVFRQG